MKPQQSLDTWIPHSLPGGWAVVFIQGDFYDGVDLWAWDVYHTVHLYGACQDDQFIVDENGNFLSLYPEIRP
jgi:hypothetical protein